MPIIPSIPSGVTAREYSQPWPVSQPMRRRRSAWPAVSTHSAVTAANNEQRWHTEKFKQTRPA